MLPTHVPPVNGRGADVPAASPTPVAVGLMAPSGSHIGAGAEQRLLDVDVSFTAWRRRRAALAQRRRAGPTGPDGARSPSARGGTVLAGTAAQRR